VGRRFSVAKGRNDRMVTVCKQARSVVLATLLIVVAMIGVAPTAQADALSEPSIGVDGQVKPE